MPPKSAAKKNKGKTPQQAKAVAGPSKAPAATGTKIQGASVPNMTYRNDGSCLIAHKEYVADIDSSAGTSQQTFALNPQASETFTWLSAIATRFEMYRFKSLKFHYRPSCSTNNEGYVVMGFDFDAYDEIPTKSVMLTWKYSSKCAVWQEANLDVTTDSRMSTFRYCDSSNRGDQRLDLLGNLFVLSQTTSTLSVGELFVSYVIEFRQPSYKLPPALSLRLARPVSAPLMPAIGDYWEVASEFGKEILGNIAIQILDPNTIKILNAGKYLLDMNVFATGAVVPPTLTFTTPVGSPSSQYNFELLNFAADAGRSLTTYKLDIDTAPVLVNFAPYTGGGGALTPLFRMSTYFAT